MSVFHLLNLSPKTPRSFLPGSHGPLPQVHGLEELFGIILRDYGMLDIIQDFSPETVAIGDVHFVAACCNTLNGSTPGSSRPQCTMSPGYIV